MSLYYQTLYNLYLTAVWLTLNYFEPGKINSKKRESVHPEAVCNDENEVEVEGEIKIRTQRYEDTLTVKTVVKVGLLDRGQKPPRTTEILLTEDSVRAEITV